MTDMTPSQNKDAEAKDMKQMQLLRVLEWQIKHLEQKLGTEHRALKQLAKLEQDIIDKNVAVEPEDFAYMLVDLGVLESVDDVEPWLEHNFQSVSSTTDDGKLYFGDEPLSQ